MLPPLTILRSTIPAELTFCKIISSHPPDTDVDLIAEPHESHANASI